MIVKQALALVCLGVATGWLAALATGMSLATLLFDIEPSDPTVGAGAACILVIVAFVSAWVPARQAACVSPVDALRADP